jgi:hypothetical protein
MTAQVSQQLIDLVTDNGSRDLTNLRIDDLETEMCQLVDAITCRSMTGILEDQAHACSKHSHCPHCDREFDEDDVSSHETKLTAKRGELKFSQPVKRCKYCRRDFFPSGPSNGD